MPVIHEPVGNPGDGVGTGDKRCQDGTLNVPSAIGNETGEQWNEFDHAGSTLRAAAVAKDAYVCFDGDCDARSGNWREYGDLYGIQSGAAAHASGGEAWRTGSFEL